MRNNCTRPFSGLFNRGEEPGCYNAAGNTVYTREEEETRGGHWVTCTRAVRKDYHLVRGGFSGGGWYPSASQLNTLITGAEEM